MSVVENGGVVARKRTMAVLGIGGLVLLGMAAVGWWMATSYGPHGYEERRTEGAPGLRLTRLRQVGLACQAYAADHDGRFPGNLESLCPGYLRPEDIVCPIESCVAPASGYAYIGGLDTGMPGSTILAHEPLTESGPDGHYVLFVDGRVELWPSTTIMRRKDAQGKGRKDPS